MKADLSRQTFDKVKHYAAVLMQQGRVAVDADWNEQHAIIRHRTQTETRDVVGLCGTPLDPPDFTDASGFRIGLTASDTELSIGAGHYYVDGLLAENEATVPYATQPEFAVAVATPPKALDQLTGTQVGLVYLDVWRRHVIPLDDPLIQEKALGEADTATRMRTSWQVKVLPLPTVSPPVVCNQSFPEWDTLTAASTGKLKADTVRPTAPPDPCEPPPSAGYIRLENQLYRVEIHKGGNAAAATFKWSRENGSIVTNITDSQPGNWIIVGSLGHDRELGFATGQWVEIVSDLTELAQNGTPLGQFVQILDVRPADNAIQLSADPGWGTIRNHNPRLRRWEQQPPAGPPAPTGDVPLQAGTDVPLEDGVVIRFSNGTYHRGDYWLIPARTANGAIEWPRNGGGPAALPPVGVRHHYCRLGFVQRTAGGKLTLLNDCRDKFPPLTELTSFFYLGGDGQEVMPDPSSPTSPAAVALPETLRVGVARGGHPVEGAIVRFSIVDTATGLLTPGAGGTVNGSNGSIPVPTNPLGVAECVWAIRSDQEKHMVEATLLVNGAPSHLPIRFSANRSVASKVRYFPPAGCDTLTPAHEVQEAIDRLAEVARLRYESGNGQEVMPVNAGNLQPLRVRAESACGPIPGATVTWTKVAGAGNGTLTPASSVTDASGIAETDWNLDGTTEAQRVLATLTSLGASAGAFSRIHPGAATVEFVANLSVASEVGYAPDCTPLKQAKVTTVEEALEALCKLIRTQKQDKVVRITRVARGDKKDLVHDSDVKVKQLLPGIVIDFDKPLLEKSVTGKETLKAIKIPNANPMCFVTLELPWPSSPEDEKYWDESLVGFQPLVLAAEVALDKSDPKILRWKPTRNTRDWLLKDLFVKAKPGKDETIRVLAHLTLKGNFIMDTEREFLDGEPFGPRSTVNSAPTSGDGRRAGDFEIWFWLRPG
jgi:Family of unknown function (DUF6519)